MARSGFSLDRLRDGATRRAAELAHEDDTNIRSRDDISRQSDGPMKPFTFQQTDFDRTEAPKDEMRTYWRQFETTPILRKPITSFASQVTEPGYYIQARGLSDDELRDLEHWLQNCAIIEAEVGKDFRQLVKKTIIQREVRGTALIEKAPSKSDDSKIAGLKLINPETMEAVTRPGQSILLHPDDLDEYEDAPEAASGGAAAYLQDLSETGTFFGRPVKQTDENKVGFRRDEIIKLTRDADVGEPFGTSRIEAVSDRVTGIKSKLSDNDEAIASKAYPLWLFYFGTEEEPWESDDIDNFMSAHEVENFHPGMKQGVRGDVNVDTISGEVAEIAEYLEFDIDWVMSAMPMPKYALGAFSGTVGQIGGVAQQQDVNRQINEARREIQDEFTPLLREVAQQMGIDEDAAKDIYLKIGSPGEPQTEVPRRENIIRYVPKDQREPNSGGEEDDGNQQQTVEDGVIDEEDEEPSDEAGAQVWHTDVSFEELQMADDETSSMADVVYDAFRSSLTGAMDDIEQTYGETPIFAVTSFEKSANGAMRDALGRRFEDEVRSMVEEQIEDVHESLNADVGRFSTNQSAKLYAQDIENSTEDAIDEMMRVARTQLRHGAEAGEDFGAIRERVEQQFNDAILRQRAELIAHMELRNVEETTKLRVWEQDPDVVGVRATNASASTPLTESLHGAEVYFDEGGLREQWMEQTREQFLHKGFDPIPQTPPFHFNDTTRLEPILSGDM